MQVINYRRQHSLSTDSKTDTLLTFVHNDADDADNADDAADADDYNWVIGIAQLKAFSCAKKSSIRLTTIPKTYLANFVDNKPLNLKETTTTEVSRNST